jgi:flagellar basal body-associated protein FliL
LVKLIEIRNPKKRCANSLFYSAYNKKSRNENSKKLAVISIIMSLLSKQNNVTLEKYWKIIMYAGGAGSTSVVIYKLIGSPKYRKNAKKIIMYLINTGLITSSVLFVAFLLFMLKKGSQRQSSNS